MSALYNDIDIPNRIRRAVSPDVIEATLSELKPPFRSVVHPNADATQRNSLLWLSRFGFDGTDTSFRNAAADSFSLLVSRWYPNASNADYQLISDFHVALYVLDDVCDEAGVGKDPRSLTGFHDEILAALHGEASTAEKHPLAHAFSDIQARMRQRMSRFWLNRLITHIQEYFEATLWEAGSRRRRAVPTTAEYVQMRAYTSAVDVYLDLIELAEGFELPLRVRTHPVVRKIALETNNIICWCNDIISQVKEFEQGDVNNIVFTLQRDGLSAEAATRAAVELHNSQMHVLRQLCKTLPSFDPDTDQMVQRYVEGMQWMIRGNFDWSIFVTRRFGVTECETQAASTWA